MPASVKAQNTFGADLQVIFVECQGTSPDVAEAFAWKMKWMGNNAIWTNERVIPTVGRGLPEVALIGVDGTVLLQEFPDQPGIGNVAYDHLTPATLFLFLQIRAVSGIGQLVQNHHPGLRPRPQQVSDVVRPDKPTSPRH